ncbi:MAG: sulfite exporter TauE/SafE family protein [Nitrososphaeraceae archaeon]
MYFLVLALSGLAIGFVGGMVGLVLGVVRFPLVMSVETSVSITAGTNLGVSTLGAITAAIRHYHQKNIQFRAFIFLAITGAAGAFIGSFFTSYVPVVLLLIIIGLIVSYESFALLNGSRIRKKRRNNITNNQLYETANSDRILTLSKNRLILLESIIGFGIGFLGGLVGLVLGSIRMPAMISVLKMQPRVAIGTNLAAASVMGVSGLIGHIINNNIDYLVLMVMGSAAMIGGYLGARYTNRFSDTSLKRIIGIVLIVVAITMFLRVFQITTHIPTGL